jgi:acyl-CoA synthetase (AMP-forming)/AMP-acid ligase II
MNIAPPLLPRISDYPAWHARRQGEAPALVLGERRQSYAELAESIDRLAAALLAAGVQKGDRVATLETPHPDYVNAFLATASIGAIWVGLNPRYQVEELRYVLADADPAVLLTRSRIGGRSYAAEIAALASAGPSLRRIVTFDGDPDVPEGLPMGAFLQGASAVDSARLATARSACGGRDPCLIVYTSGSTGAPKGALLHHEGIAAFSLAQNEVWPADPMRMVNYFPINHIGCVIDCTSPCLVAGGTLIFMEQFDPAACMDLMVRERATIWGSVPSVFQMQLALPDFTRYDLSAVQLVLWEGAALPVEFIEQLLRICPRLATNYGMTEATSGITVVEPTADLDVLANSVGFPFPGVELRLVDDAGRNCGSGVTGEIQTRSRYNFLGYWRRPEATQAAFTADGWFRTGDLGERRADGRLRIVGRIKEMYKSGGYNVYPREVEIALEAHPAVALAAVVAAPDPRWQEVGVAYVAPRTPVTPDELEQHCRSRLANYKVPKRIVIEPNLPLLPIGKVDKPALKARAARGE